MADIINFQQFARRISNTKPIAPIPQTNRKPPPQKKYYFCLNIEEKFHLLNDESDKKQSITSLKPGVAYLLHITAKADSDNASSVKSISSAYDIDVILEQDDGIDIIGECTKTISKNNIETFEDKFELSVRKECSFREIELKLGAKRKDTNENVTEISKLRCTIEVFNQQDRAKLKEINISPDKHYPEEVAIIIINYNEISDSSLRIDVINYPARREKIIKFPVIPRELNLAESKDKGKSPMQYRFKIRDFSRNLPLNFIICLKRLICRYKNELKIVIVDETGLNFPWEILEINIDEHCLLPIGSLASITRWFPFQYFDYPSDLYVEDEVCAGSSIAYIKQNDQNLYTHIEKKILDTISPIPEYHLKLNDMIKQLAKPLNAVALIYIGAHNESILDKTHGELNETPIFSTNIRMYHLEDMFRQSVKSVVFMNACYTGLLKRDNFGKCKGIPEKFLSRNAKIYLGTLATVGSEFAGNLAKMIIERACNTEKGVKIADILKEKRNEAVKRILGENPEENDWNDYLNIFTYVQFGNPLCRLKLTQVSQESCNRKV